MSTIDHYEIGSILINRYHITKWLGSGGMANVYAAYDADCDREVALKILKEECYGSSKLHERFLREFEILSTLSHPAIVSVFELYKSAQNIPFFAMELLNGDTLAARQAKTPNSLSVDGLLTALKKIATALAYLHSNNIVYCDLKPDNIMVNSDGAELKVTLFDFGVSYQRPAESKRESRQANLLGTSLYMSPEAIRGEAPHPLWDIYSFGALAFEVLTGQVPFSQKELFAITASHLLAKVPDISHYNPDLPRGVGRFVMVCLAKDPVERYQSMNEALDRLEKLGHESSASGILNKLRHFWQNHCSPTVRAHAQMQRTSQHSDDTPQSAEENR
jgi:serine/threonine-protein kinase